MSFFRLLIRNRLALAGLIVIGLVLALVIVTPILPLYEPNVTDTANRFLKPFEGGHILGTDHLGRDLLSRLLWGTQLSLAVGISAAVFAAFFGAAGVALASMKSSTSGRMLLRQERPAKMP